MVLQRINFLCIRFFRGSVQTTLPPYKRAKTGWFCASFDGEISHRRDEASRIKGCVVKLKGRKLNFEESLQDFEGKLPFLKDAYAFEKSDDHAPNDEELLQDILTYNENPS